MGVISFFLAVSVMQARRSVYFPRPYLVLQISAPAPETEKRFCVLLHSSLLSIQITHEDVLVSSEYFCCCMYLSFPQINAL